MNALKSFPAWAWFLVTLAAWHGLPLALSAATLSLTPPQAYEDTAMYAVIGEAYEQATLPNVSPAIARHGTEQVSSLALLHPRSAVR